MLPDVISTLWSDTRGLSMSCLVQEMHCTLQTRASHSADPGVAHCRPRRRTLQTQASHTADPGVAHCRPRRRTLQTRGVAHCRPRRRTLQTRASHTAHPSAGQITYKCQEFSSPQETTSTSLSGIQACLHAATKADVQNFHIKKH